MRRARSNPVPRPLLRHFLVAAPLCCGVGLAQAQDEEWEYEPGEGYHEEEWYDPSDWFDQDETVSYEGDWWEYDYDLRDPYFPTHDDYGWHYQWSPVDRRWTSDFGWHEDPYEEDLGWHYEWNPTTGHWETDYGWHEEATANVADDADLGWYWLWDAQQERWVRTYGLHDSDYEYDFAAWRDDPQSEGARSQEGADEEQRPDAEARFTGRVDSFNRVRLDGETKGHTLVRLRTKDGSSRVVDLGPEVDLAELDLAQGDRVKVCGREGTISDRDVLMATAVRVGGERTRIPRPGEEGAPSRLQGTLDGYKKLKREGEKAEHLLVRLKLEDGTRRVVDLGEATEMSQLDLSAGDTVRVEGCEKNWDGMNVLCAEKLRVGGEKVQLEREKETQREPHQEGDRKKARGKEIATLSGRLDGFKEMQLDGASGEHLFVRLRLRDGTSRVVDLGPSARLSEMDMEQGDPVRVEGPERQIDGKTVLVAEKLRLDGEKVRAMRAARKDGREQ